VATVFSYPMQLVKTRMQQEGATSHQAYGRTLATMSHIVRNEGLLGFYKGLGANLWKVTPQSAILLAMYEKILILL
jgi:solute carrier family 25 folate transporter 32